MPEVTARINELQGDGNSSASGNAAAWLRNAIAATEDVAGFTRRGFAAVLGTWYLDVPAQTPANEFGLRYWLPFDVVSITSLALKTADPLTYGAALVENTDFLAQREDGDSNKPMVYLDMLSGQRLTAGARQLKLVGVRGYSYEVESTGLTGTLSDATDTSLTTNATAENVIYPGMMLKMASEQMYASAVSGTTVTVERGQNGTTATSHSAVAISARRYPRWCEEATKLRALDLFTAKRTAGQGTSGGEDLSFASPGIYRQFRSLLTPHKRLTP